MRSSNSKYALMFHSILVNSSDTTFNDLGDELSCCFIVVIKTTSKYFWETNGLNFAFLLLCIWSGQCLSGKLLNNQIFLQVLVFGFLLLYLVICCDKSFAIFNYQVFKSVSVSSAFFFLFINWKILEVPGHIIFILSKKLQ